MQHTIMDRLVVEAMIEKTLLLSATLSMAAALTAANDWTDWRGPARDGNSPETGLASSWSRDGENLAWRAPFGARSAPIVVGGRIYLQNAAGAGPNLQERIQCIDADSGELLWEHGINLYMSDVPPHRVAWASPVADPATGNVYAFTVSGTLIGLTPEGKVLWNRSLNEEFGLITTHGGRTQSPVVEGDLVIVSGLSSGWGDQARGGHRVFAFHKTTGQTYWVSSPGGQPYDTVYAPLYAAEVDGTRILMIGGGDGSMLAVKPQTGEPVWRFEFSKRGVNTGAIQKDGIVVVSQGEENLHTSEMGLLAAIDARSRGEIKIDNAKWRTEGFLATYSTPTLDGDRFYVVDIGANLAAFDFATGKELWRVNIGHSQRASPVVADGKIYVGSVGGSFYILKPGPDGATVLDKDDLGTPEEPEEIYASVAVSGGRVYLATTTSLYAIGSKERKPAASSPVSTHPAGSPGEPAYLQVVPTELVLAPGEKVELTARLFDEGGRFVRETDALFSLEGLKGAFSGKSFTASSDPVFQSGKVVAAAGELKGASRIRVVPGLPWKEDFESIPGVPGAWVNATGKFEIRDAATMPGVSAGKILVKKSDNPFTRRARVFMGPKEWSDYTIEIDARATRKGRQQGSVGVVAQRYQLTLMGNTQRLEIQSWQPETERTAQIDFPWEADRWYRLKLEVRNEDGGSVVARGKAWRVGEPEPVAWMVERRDASPNLMGSVGIYADAQPVEVFFDNLEVRGNE
jgi:outer membrane protein assembly factor BamB